MVKRLRLPEMRQHDLDNGTCHVRLIEMDVDAICTDVGHPGYSQQFWRDVQLYGLREAFVYISRFVEKHAPGNAPLATRVNGLRDHVARAEEDLGFARGIYYS